MGATTSKAQRAVSKTTGSIASSLPESASTQPFRRQYPRRSPTHLYQQKQSTDLGEKEQKVRDQYDDFSDTVSNSLKTKMDGISTGPGPNGSINQTHVVGPSVHPRPGGVSESKDEAISLDARDPDFAASLRALGPVQPMSTRSNTSTFHARTAKLTVSASSPDSSISINHASPQQHTAAHQAVNNAYTSPVFPDASQNPAIAILQARTRLAKEAEQEFTMTRTGQAMSASGDGPQGRRFLDIGTIRQILAMRDTKQLSPAEIENDLGLTPGAVEKLTAFGEVKIRASDAKDSALHD